MPSCSHIMHAVTSCPCEELDSKQCEAVVTKASQAQQATPAKRPCMSTADQRSTVHSQNCTRWHGAALPKALSNSPLSVTLQDKLTKAVTELLETQQTVRLLCEAAAATNPATAASCGMLRTAPPPQGPNATHSMRLPLQVLQIQAGFFLGICMLFT